MRKKKTTKSSVKDLRSQHQKINNQYSSINISVKSIITVIVVIIIVLALFYFLTIGILNKKSKVKVSSNTAIQYKEILAGESFTQSDKEYLVFYYDSTADDATSNYNLVTSYSEKNSDVYMYTVDLSEGLNKDYRSDEANKDAKDASELKINTTTLIRFKNGKIVEYITDNIEEYLNK